MKYVLSLFFILASALSFSGCTGLLDRLKSNRACGITRQDAGDLEFSVNFSRYGDPTPSEKAIVVFPPITGTGFYEESYANLFCYAGFDVYLVNSWTHMGVENFSLNAHDQVYEKGQNALGLVLKQTPAAYVGLLGTGTGALHAEVALQKQERVNALFVITGAANFADVFAKSSETYYQDLQTARVEVYHHKSADETAAALAANFSYEPAAFPDSVQGRDLGLSVSLRDDSIPTRDQLKLKELWPSAKVITYDSSHNMTLFKTWFWDRAKILNFFDVSQKARKISRSH